VPKGLRQNACVSCFKKACVSCVQKVALELLIENQIRLVTWYTRQTERHGGCPWRVTCLAQCSMQNWLVMCVP
jgi:hypothetical protein